MGLQRKLVCLGLAAFTLWPLVHIWLVKRFDIDPWKLGGWGMYAAPRINTTGLRVYARARGSDRFEYLAELPVEVHPAAGEFLQSYRWLRKLVRPDRLSRELMQLQPQIERLRIVVYQPVVEPVGAMVVTTEVTYEYPQ